jgi:SARP family transcriptional regulator, regulator of embCAB operon
LELLGKSLSASERGLVALQDDGPSPSWKAESEVQISLLGGFSLLHDSGRMPISTSPGAERLLAFVALRNRPIRRGLIAGTLWPDVEDGRANASLRSALARLSVAGRQALDVDAAHVSLAQGVSVDVAEARALAHGLLGGCLRPDGSDLGRDALGLLSADLLPGWYEDWAILEADKWHELRRHALEVLARILTAMSRFGEAALAALAAVKAEPLSESARAALIRVHLAEGNRAEAVNELERHGRLLRAELGLTTSGELRRLVADANAD